MRRTLCFLSAVICALTLYSQVDATYYATIDGLRDSVLKSTLHQLCQVKQVYKYGTRKYGEKGNSFYTWDGFDATDRRADGTIWDMYSEQKHYFPTDEFGALSAAGMAIEHSFPKSWWGGNVNNAYQDLFHLCPAETKANTAKSNYGPGIIDSTIVFENAVFKTGYRKGLPLTRVFEPCDEYKGDFARAYFYIATVYEDLHWIDTAVYTKQGIMSSNTSSAYFCMDNGSYLEFQPWLQETLLEWHRKDPVSQKELDRQEIIYQIQGNRNPFIDYPELVEYIWGQKMHTGVALADMSLTCSDDYLCPPDRDNIIAFPVRSYTDSTFTVSWRDAGADSYLLDVYTLEQLSKADTLVNVPIISKAIVSQSGQLSGNDDTYLNSDGACAVILGTAKGNYELTISNFPVQNHPLTLVFRACISKNDTEAAMLIETDGKEIETIELTFDEIYYFVSLPAATQTITLKQAKSGKRISLQQLFLLDGDDSYLVHSLEGYPRQVTGTEHIVQPDIDYNTPTTFYFTVTPDACPVSNEVQFVFTRPKKDDPQEPENPETGLTNASNNDVKFILLGNTLTLINPHKDIDIVLYDSQGKQIATLNNNRNKVTLSAHGLYLLTDMSGNIKEKILY